MKQPFSFRPVFSQMIQRDQVSRFSDCGHTKSGDFDHGNTCAAGGKKYSDEEIAANRKKVQDYYAGKKGEGKPASKEEPVKPESKPKKESGSQNFSGRERKSGERKFKVMITSKEEYEKADKDHNYSPEETEAGYFYLTGDDQARKMLKKLKKDGKVDDSAQLSEE
jgi:hypothetical protein